VDVGAVLEEDEEEEVDAGGSAPDNDRDRDAATMMGGVDSSADENSPLRLRNRLIATDATPSKSSASISRQLPGSPAH